MNYIMVILYLTSDSLDYLNGAKTASPADEIRSIDFLINYCEKIINDYYAVDKPDGEPTFLDASELTYKTRQAIKLRDARRKQLHDCVDNLKILKADYILEIENMKQSIETNKQLV